MYHTKHMEKQTSYHPVAKFCHWTIVIIVAAQFVSSWLMSSIRHGAELNFFATAHLSFVALFLIPLAAGLFFMRFYKPVLKTEIETTGLIKIATAGLHYSLYAFLVIVPISGVVAASFRGKAVSFLGFFDVPLLTVSDPSLLMSFGKMHSEFAEVMGVIALVHIAAALYHHLIIKDDILNRMRPNRA